MTAESLYRSCTVPGCDEPHFGRGYCQMHYLRLVRHGSTDKPRRRRTRRLACRVPGCDKLAACIRDDLCMTHYQQERRRRIRDAAC